jgi:hypothetical protein
MTIFALRPEDIQRIKAAVERARRHPLDIDTIKQHASPIEAKLKFADRKPGIERPSSEHVGLPFGFRAAFSFEQQPVGLCLHMSLSAPDKGKVPRPEAVSMILQALGFDPDITHHHGWLEEFEPGHDAVNVLIMLNAGPVGHA